MEINNIQPKIRHLSEMKEVVLDQEFVKTADPELYYMYRDLAENEQDKEKIKEYKLRYDITVINPVMLGKEYNKTAGHDHPLVPGTEITYTELYEVLEGEVIFLMQDSKENNIKDVYAIKANKNDKVIVPPNYEHIMINTSNEKVKTANWVCNDFSENIYEPFKKRQGFSYYAIKSNSAEIEWIKNKNYDYVPELRFLEPNLWLKKFNINKDKEIYNLIKDLSKLDFLKNPQ
ncbi:MAG: glucose-6-phosphate isomerase family protein, partial [Patescibacteria group bacterium]